MNTATVCETPEFCACENVQLSKNGEKQHCPDCGATYKRTRNRGKRGWEMDVSAPTAQAEVRRSESVPTPLHWEWVRSGMACVNADEKAIPWCAREYFVSVSDFDVTITAERARVASLEKRVADDHAKASGIIHAQDERIAMLADERDRLRTALQQVKRIDDRGHRESIANAALSAQGSK